MKYLKQLLLVTITLFMLLGCVQKSTAGLPKQWKEPYPETEEHYKGSINYYIEYAYRDYESLEWEESLYVAEVEFDKNNNPISRTLYGSTNLWTIIEYNENGDIIEKREHMAPEEPEPTEENLNSVTKYEFDDKGYTISKSETDWTKKTYTELFTYDFKNREIKIGSEHSYDVYKFDERGLPESRTNYDTSTNKKDYRYLYKYNDKGQLVKHYRDKGDEDTTIYTYNEQGYIASLDDYEYKNFEYKFDDQGNWIEMKEYRDGELWTITVRKYEYY